MNATLDKNTVMEFIRALCYSLTDTKEEHLTDFFLTGSRAWGAAREDSDYDIVVHHEMANRILSVVDNNKSSRISPANNDGLPYGSGSFYFLLDGKYTINIVGLSLRDYNAWRKATLTFLYASIISSTFVHKLHERKTCIDLFDYLCGLFAEGRLLDSIEDVL